MKLEAKPTVGVSRVVIQEDAACFEAFLDLVSQAYPEVLNRIQQGAARVRVSARRILVELAAYCPFAAELRQIVARLTAPERLVLN